MKSSRTILIFVLFAGLAAGRAAAAPPTMTLGNSALRAEVLLPDAAEGFYRGSRFGWAGMIESLQCDGHSYFTAWSGADAPDTNRGAGPATEFDLPDPDLGVVSPPGFAEAASDGLFLKIGVGWLLRDAEARYHPFRAYEIAEAGTWRVERDGDSVTMTHDLPVRNGLGCLYRKRISLDPLRRILTVTETLRNIGMRTFETVGYCHNFLRIDDTPIGPAYRLSTTPVLAPSESPPPILRKCETGWRFSGPVTDTLFLRFPPPESSGFRIQVRNEATGGSLEIRTNEKILAFRLFADGTTLCPETFVAVRLLPGQEKTWSWQYLFQPNPSN